MTGALSVLKANVNDGMAHSTVRAASALGGPTGHKVERDLHLWAKRLYGFELEPDSIDLQLPFRFGMENFTLHVLSPFWVLRSLPWAANHACTRLATRTLCSA